MFLRDYLAQRALESLPRRRGGVSAAVSYFAFSLSVFPAGAGVFLSVTAMNFVKEWSSPQARGCFQKLELEHKIILVFPAGAGVFPLRIRMVQCPDGLPRRRGGVSMTEVSACQASAVFPAGAGVFRSVTACPMGQRCLPRRRGGVSGLPKRQRTRCMSSPQARGCFRVSIYEEDDNGWSSPQARGCFHPFP